MGSNEKKRRRSRKQAIFLVLFLLLAVGGLQVWEVYSKHRQLVHVSFSAPDGTASPQFSLEVVATAAKRGQGLMFRKELAANQGMLFVFPTEDIHTFWMKNTYVPLDIIFLDSDFLVLGTLEDMKPLDERRRSIGVPSSYAVELLAGSIAQHGISAGWKMTYRGTIPRPQ
jgi:uncharacterized membrane protein (UPF0127 family)